MPYCMYNGDINILYTHNKKVIIKKSQKLMGTCVLIHPNYFFCNMTGPKPNLTYFITLNK